ncbi:MAG: hypothetical protein QXP98_04325 [Thermoproteus sp.]
MTAFFLFLLIFLVFFFAMHLFFSLLLIREDAVTGLVFLFLGGFVALLTLIFPLLFIVYIVLLILFSGRRTPRP